MRIVNVAQVRKDLASLLAANEIVVIARYGTPVGLLLGIPGSALGDDLGAVTEAEFWSQLKDAYRRLAVAQGREHPERVRKQRRKRIG
jgi:hypothetical protein